jgi:hypothetical protein
MLIEISCIFGFFIKLIVCLNSFLLANINFGIGFDED